MFNLFQEVAEELTHDLKKRCEESPGVAENAIFALGALANALPSSAHSHIEVICDSLSDLFKLKEGTNEWIQYSSLLSLSVLTHALHPTDTARFSEIVTLLVDSLW